jgi:hypothetical protein
LTTTITDLEDFKALDPFFRIIENPIYGIDLAALCSPKR